MKLYEKPVVEVIDFNVNNSIMDDQGGAGQGPSGFGDGVGDVPNFG